MADLDLATILADGEYLKREGDVLVGDIPEGGTGGGITTEDAVDATAAAFAAGTHTNVTVTYNDAANSISLAAAGGPTVAGVDVLREPFDNFTALPWTTAGTPTIVTSGRTGNAAQLVGATDTLTLTIPDRLPVGHGHDRVRVQRVDVGRIKQRCRVPLRCGGDVAHIVADRVR